MQTLTIAQRKGGTGKTTTAHAIGAALAARGDRVLFVDLDAQANLSYITNAGDAEFNALDVLTGRAGAAEAAIPLKTIRGASIITATPRLAGTDATITGARREYRLADALAQIAGDFDYCIIDTPPALGALTVNALTASDRVIIPCLADVLSIQALAQIAETIGAIQATSNPRLQIAGILLTRYQPRQVLTRDAAQALNAAAAKIGARVFKTAIRETVSIREAQATATDVFTYSPRSAGATDYSQLIAELF